MEAVPLCRGRRRPGSGGDGATLVVKQQITVMNTPDDYFAAGSDQGQKHESMPVVNNLALESLSKPLGTFGGTTDRIFRVRNGEAIPADTGDQGGGQN